MKIEIKAFSVLGALLSFGLIALGILLGNSIVKFKTINRSVKVKGLSEKEVIANKAIWPITFYNSNNSIDSLYKNIDHTSDKLINYLKIRGFKDVEISKSIPSITDRHALNYVDSNKIKLRYGSKRTITVYTDKIDVLLKAKEDIVELGKHGVIVAADDYENQTEFIYTELNSIKPKMIEEATINARKVANKFATDSQSKLGKIKTANQGQFSIYSRDRNTPHIKKVRVVSSIEYYLVD